MDKVQKSFFFISVMVCMTSLYDNSDDKRSWSSNDSDLRLHQSFLLLLMVSNVTRAPARRRTTAKTKVICWKWWVDHITLILIDASKLIESLFEYESSRISTELRNAGRQHFGFAVCLFKKCQKWWVNNSGQDTNSLKLVNDESHNFHFQWMERLWWWRAVTCKETWWILALDTHNKLSITAQLARQIFATRQRASSRLSYSLVLSLFLWLCWPTK